MLYNSIWLKRFTSLKSDEIFKWILWMCDMMWEYSASGRFLVAYDSASWLVTVVDDISGSLFAFTFQLVICTPLPCVYLGTAMRVHSRRHLLLRPTRSYLNFIYPLVYDETIICSKKINTAFDSIPTTVESTRRRARLVLHSHSFFCKTVIMPLNYLKIEFAYCCKGFSSFFNALMCVYKRNKEHSRCLT